MVRISDYEINSKFTAPRQNPSVYTGTLSVAQTTIASGSIGQQLASTNITVPSGTQSDIALIYFSTDGRYYPTHSLIMSSTTQTASLYINLYRSSQTNYILRAFATNTSSSSWTISAFTATAWIRLITSPF